MRTRIRTRVIDVIVSLPLTTSSSCFLFIAIFSHRPYHYDVTVIYFDLLPFSILDSRFSSLENRLNLQFSLFRSQNQNVPISLPFFSAFSKPGNSLLSVREFSLFSLKREQEDEQKMRNFDESNSDKENFTKSLVTFLVNSFASKVKENISQFRLIHLIFSAIGKLLTLPSFGAREDHEDQSALFSFAVTCVWFDSCCSHQ